MPIETTAAGILDIENAKLRASQLIATQKIGIGEETAPTHTFQIKTPNPVMLLEEFNGSTSTSAGQLLASSGVLHIQSGTATSSDSKGDIAFSSIDGVTRHMTIAGSTGYVGIGTFANPASHLHIQATAAELRLEAPVGTAHLELGGELGGYIDLKGPFAEDSDVRIETTGDGANIKVNGNNSFGLWTDGSPRMTVTGTGNVGIGTGSPTTRLELAANGGSSMITLKRTSTSTTGAKGGIRFTENTTGYNVATIAGLADGNNTSGAIAFYTKASSTDTGLYLPSTDERMRISSSGNVGIGTASPGTKLDVYNSSGGADVYALKIQTDNTSSADAGALGPGIGFYQRWWSGGGVQIPMGAIHCIKTEANGASGGGLAFRTGNDAGASMGTRMVINKAGNVGIGTTSPSDILHIVGNTRTTGLTYGLKLAGTLDGTKTESWYRLLKDIGERNGGNGIRTYCKLQIVASGLHETVTFDFNQMIGVNQTSGCTFNLYGHDHYTSRVGVLKLRLAQDSSGDIFLDMYINHDVVSVSRTWTVTLYVEGGSVASAPTTFLEKITTDPTYSIEFDIVNALTGACGNSSEKTFVFAKTGNVGIGTTSPAQKFHVMGGTTANTRDVTMFLESGGADVVPLINSASGGQNIKTIAGLEITSVDIPLSTHGRHSYIESVSAGDTYNTDLEFRARGTDSYYQYGGSTNPTQKQARISYNGIIYARVGTAATGADYAELFEWDDGNPNNEDRTGMTVQLMEGGKISVATSNTLPEDVIGVVSVIYGFLGNDHWDEWNGKYIKDSLGRIIHETVDMVSWRDENDKEQTFRVNKVPQDLEIPETATYYQDQVPKLNPEYDETKKYVGRGKRKEWSAIGLVGRLRVLKNYPKSSRWIKIQDIDNDVEEYLSI